MTDSAGLCDVPSLCVYANGVLHRCSYEFGHDGQHSWQDRPRHMGWTGVHPEDSGKLTSAEAEHLHEEDDDEPV